TMFFLFRSSNQPPIRMICFEIATVRTGGPHVDMSNRTVGKRLTRVQSRHEESTMGNQLTITPCLWFDGQAEQAARFYVEVFPDSRITTISHYGEAGKEIHGQHPGDV